MIFFLYNFGLYILILEISARLFFGIFFIFAFINIKVAFALNIFFHQRHPAISDAPKHLDPTGRRGDGCSGRIQAGHRR